MADADVVLWRVASARTAAVQEHDNQEHSTRSAANEDSVDWSRRERGARERDGDRRRPDAGGTEPPGKMQGPGARSLKVRAPRAGHEATGRQGGRRSDPGAGKGEAQRAPDAGQGKGTRESQGAPGKDQPKATESQHEKSPPRLARASPRRPSQRPPKRQPEKGQPKATERQPEKGQPKASERQPEETRRARKANSRHAADSRVQVSEQQRSGVRERLFKEGKFKKTRLNVRVNVGTRVPRSVRLLPLPVCHRRLGAGLSRLQLRRARG